MTGEFILHHIPNLVPEVYYSGRVVNIYVIRRTGLDEYTALVPAAAEHDCSGSQGARGNPAFLRYGHDFLTRAKNNNIIFSTSTKQNVTSAIMSTSCKEGVYILQSPFLVGWGLNKSLVAYPRTSGRFSIEG